MPVRPSSHPTEAELEILNVLWRRGPSTVREVHEALQADRTTGLTTTLKLLQVMTEKGLVTRGDEPRPHRYAPASPEETTQAGLLGDLAQRAFEGSLRKLLIRAVEDGDLDSDELEELQALIDNIREGQRGET
jgi:BlaI family penicillinase repressor